MYQVREETKDELRDRSLVRISEKKVETAHFMGPRERLLIHFGDRGMLQLSSGDIERTTYSRPHRRQNPPHISLKLHGFDEKYHGTERAVVAGTWGPEYPSRYASEKMPYRGGLELLPPSLVEDAIALLDHRGGVDLALAPWETEED